MGRNLFSGIAGAVVLFASASVGVAAECGDIVLGSAISLTGEHSNNGIHVKNGYEFAIKKLKDAGGVKVGDKCFNFRVTYYDNESKRDRGATLAERLITQDKVQYLLGPYSAGLTEAIAPVTEKYKIPMVDVEGASRSLFKNGYKYLFAVPSTSEQYLASTVALAAAVAEKNGKKPSDVRVAIAVGSDPFSHDVRAGVLEGAKKYGMKAIIDEKIPQEFSDISAFLTKVKLDKPDVVMVSGGAKAAATAVRQIGEMAIDVPMIALTHCEAADVIGKFGPAANGILCATQWAATLNYQDAIFGTASNYAKEFKAHFSEYADKFVPYQAAQASAAVYIFADAFSRAGSLDKDKIRAALASTDMATFYGGIRFSEAGSNIAKPMVLRQVQNGRYNVVAPSKSASHELDWPRRAR